MSFPHGADSADGACVAVGERPSAPAARLATPIPGGHSPAAVKLDPAGRSWPHRRDLRVSLLIGLCCLAVYNANLRAISAGDSLPSRYLPFAIWRDHTVRLDPVASITAQGRAGTAFWLLPVADRHWISLYPVVLPVLIAPLYLPAAAYLHLRGWTDSRLDDVARVMEKLSASLIAAVSSALLYLLLRRRATEPIAVLLTLAYAFGTTTWVISSQALWQHGMAELLLVAALLVLTSACTGRRAFAAGLLCGLIAGNRPPDVFLAAALGGYALHWAGRRKAGLVAAGAALPLGLVLAYNLGVAHHVAGAYARVGEASFLQHDPLSGLAGLFFSPARGLFVFSPFLLFLALAWRHPPDEIEERRLSLAIAAGIFLQILLYSLTDWRGGICWGPRFLTDLVPLLVWMLAPIVAGLRTLGRACFVAAVACAAIIQAIGAFFYTGATDVALFPPTSGADALRPAWEWRNAPFVASLREGLAPAELPISVRGYLDAFEVGGRVSPTATVGDEVVAAGWALAGDATPWQVAVAIDGEQVATSSDFEDRPDVSAAQRTTRPAGWRVRFPTRGLAPGDHEIAAFAWASAAGERRYLGSRTLAVQAPPKPQEPASEARPSTSTAGGADAADDLRAAVATAASRLRSRQDPAGHWLTTFTSAPSFVNPGVEMNVYLTALLVDLLDPIAAAAGLEPSLLRAREHLTRQIEESGLVRYHGLPDAPGIGTLGCAISPDSDDTALVWRLAPSRDRLRLADAVATLERYRTPSGLYRTWLAPREEYQCIDPGRDPNPTDIGIQLHVLMFLAQTRPWASRALCDALRPLVDDDRVWVYYRMAPVVPILRLADLRRMGCALELPDARLRTDTPGQDLWLSAAQMLARTLDATGSAPDPAETRAVLRRVAANDFATLREAPPLLYHNDLTAGVRRYYWSEDAGYALWLRLALAETNRARTNDDSLQIDTSKQE